MFGNLLCRLGYHQTWIVHQAYIRGDKGGFVTSRDCIRGCGHSLVLGVTQGSAIIWQREGWDYATETW